jgi:cysteine synthase/rhodanese-related sulfurtransferase
LEWTDKDLLERFERDIWSKMPHLETSDGAIRVACPTPLIDLTADLHECARQVYKTALPQDLKVYGKFDSGLMTGSIKARPAFYIIHDAIKAGKLRNGDTIMEATSGNFGIALGKIADMGITVVSLVSRRLQEGVFEDLRKGNIRIMDLDMGITVVSLVSRRLQEGVFEDLRKGNIRIMDLDMDICPAPGMAGSRDALAAKAAAANIRSRLSEMGLDPGIFDENYTEIESLLTAQDIINLAKLLARIYGLFCPEQYDNQLNIEVHRTITGPEIDQQLREDGQSMGDYEIFCNFGTGGTSSGLSRYVSERYGKKSVHLVFPPPGQDVAGIRTRDKADGLTMYSPQDYATEKEVDFGQARHLLRFFASRGRDMGESSALALYSAMQTAYQNNGGRFVVIIADGIHKYKKSLQEGRTQVSLEDAAADASQYDRIVWVHTQYTPKEEGIELIAKSLGVEKGKIRVPKARTIERLLMTRQIPEEMGSDIGEGKSLFVCMAGNTSLMAVKILANMGINAESLSGGITNLPGGMERGPGRLVRVATE